MTIKAAIAQHLIAKATAASSRVYRVGQTPTSAALPYITFQRVSNAHIRHMGGSSQFTTARFQINCWAASESAAESLGEEVRVAFDTFTGTLGSGGDAVTVQGAFLEEDYDDFADPNDGSETGLFRRILDFLVWHAEAAPSPSL